MYFYVDESGHTGANLFDAAQPTLYYGVLSSPINVDLVAESGIAALRRVVGKPRLHAAELGNEGLARIAPALIRIQKRLQLRFDCYRVNKPDHAIICFFDQVFDQAMNPAVPFTSYWTPLRYMLLCRLARLFDEGARRLAWAARINVKNDEADAALVELGERLTTRIDQLPDARTRQLVGDALAWAVANPREIQYNVTDPGQRKQVMPNIIGFQAVMHGIGHRVRANGRAASRIIVDRQTEFNQAQRTLAEFYASAAGMRAPMGLGMPEVDFRGMPTVPIEFKAGTDSCGLELVDVFLWIFKRGFEGKEIPLQLTPLVKYNLTRGRTDDISLQAIEDRWADWFNRLPDLEDVPQRQLDRALEFLQAQESRRLKAVNALRLTEARPGE